MIDLFLERIGAGDSLADTQKALNRAGFTNAEIAAALPILLAQSGGGGGGGGSTAQPQNEAAVNAAEFVAMTQKRLTELFGGDLSKAAETLAAACVLAAIDATVANLPNLCASHLAAAEKAQKIRKNEAEKHPPKADDLGDDWAIDVPDF